MTTTHHTTEQTGEQAPTEHAKFAGQGTHIADIRHAVTTKRNKIFLLTDQTGDIAANENGLGLYFRDTCFLDQAEVRLQDKVPLSLMDDSSKGDTSVFELTNPELDVGHGHTLLKERLSIRRSYSITDKVTQTIDITNLAHVTAQFDLTVKLASHFTNMFVVRGDQPGKRGLLHPPQVHQNSLIFRYDGADQHERTTTITFHPAPQSITNGTATFPVHLKLHDTLQIEMDIVLEDREPNPSQADPHKTRHSQTTDQQKHAEMHEFLADLPQIETTNPLFDRALAQAFGDLRMLATVENGDTFLAAGVPWYVALFGRDSCISAYQMLAYQPELARSTLEVLAGYQGTKDNAFQDEEPGKILHELRVGEKANLHEVPQFPYYGTVDATPWFVLLLGEYIRWTDDLSLFHQMKDNVERALAWMDTNAKQSGFLTYGTKSEKGLTNQGWKDSGNSIVNADGSLAKPPIALVEVQGYAYAAKLSIAQVFRQTGDEQRAQQLEKEAADLKQRFNQTFWMAKSGFYALAIQMGGKLAQVVASNPGQALFTRIVDDDKVAAVVKRLMAEDMYTGWGIRTLSAKEASYNPLDYQVGSVWPHDNSLIALGMQRTGHVEEAEKVFTGIFDAATRFEQMRLPEVFDGFSRQQYDRPVRYPVACSPQAWAAGALPLLLHSALGLEADAHNKTLRIHNPCLPSWLPQVTVRGLRVGQAKVNLRFQRVKDVTLAAVMHTDGDLTVNVEY